MSSDVEETIDRLEETGLLTERQAEAFVLRDIELVPRQATAESMGVSVNTLDNRLARAREIVEEAREGLDVIEEARHEDIPKTCGNCGDGLGGRFVQEDGDSFCLECAGVETDD